MDLIPGMDAEILHHDDSRRHDGGAKRRQIMDGARSVFLATGFDGASMNDIARAAGVSKGTLYSYFGSKDDLFDAIIRAEFAQAAERLCTFRREGDVRDMLIDFGVRLIARMAEPNVLALARVVVAATEKFPKIGVAFYQAGPSVRRDAPRRRARRARKDRRPQGPRSGARRLAIRRLVPELCLQADPVRRRRPHHARGDRGGGGRRGGRVPEGLRDERGSRLSLKVDGLDPSSRPPDVPWHA